jgi:hypothetical protein
MDNKKPTKFHKSLGNVKDEDVTDGEILLLRALIRDTEQVIINYRLKEYRIGRKVKKLYDSIKEDRRIAQEASKFIDNHPLFAAICQASGISPLAGKRKFYKRVEDTINRKIQKRIEHDKNKDEPKPTITS